MAAQTPASSTVTVKGIVIPSPFAKVTFAPDGKPEGQSTVIAALRAAGGEVARPNQDTNPIQGTGCEVVYAKADNRVLVAAKMVKGGGYVVYYDTLLEPSADNYLDTWRNHLLRAIAMLKAESAATAPAPTPAP